MIRYVRLSDLIHAGVAELQTGPFGTMLHASAYRSQGTPVIAVQHVGDGFLNPGEMPMIGEGDIERLFRYKVKANDILFCRKGAVERRALIRAHEEGFIQGSDCIRLRLNEQVISPPFVSYVIGSPSIKEWLQTNANGATMPSLNQSILGELPIPLLPFKSQNRIASILGSLDDKIELNRRMNETLEAMSRAIFRSWFVRFDPVRIKARGGDPVKELGLSSEIAALFPNSFVDSELGKIPSGWGIGAIRDLCQLNRNQVNPSDRPEDTFHHYSLPAFDEECLPIEEAGASIKSNKFDLRWPCLLVSKLNPHIPRIWLVSSPSLGNSVASTEFLVLTPTNRSNLAYLYSRFSDQVFMRHLEEMITGTSNSHRRVQPEVFMSQKEVVPPLPLVGCFEAVADPLLSVVNANRRESAILAQTRDYLLPRLLRGLPVTDGEFVGSQK